MRKYSFLKINLITKIIAAKRVNKIYQKFQVIKVSKRQNHKIITLMFKTIRIKTMENNKFKNYKKFNKRKN